MKGLAVRNIGGVPDYHSPSLDLVAAGEIEFFRGDIIHRHCNYNHHSAVFHGDIVFAGKVAEGKRAQRSTCWARNMGTLTIRSNDILSYIKESEDDINWTVTPPANYAEIISRLDSGKVIANKYV